MESFTFSVFCYFVYCCLLPLAVEPAGSCALGKHHKTVPGPEELAGTHCSAWSGNACCTRETAVSLSANSTGGTWLKFRWDHCLDEKKPPLSEKCRNHFALDLCFYECSPNTGPWLVSDRRKIRQSRFRNVPICQPDCDAWFKDCQTDWTCTDNWVKNFRWEGGVNRCPANQPCRQFKDVYSSAQEFCETVFDHSFKYALMSEPCMTLAFNGSATNPNDNVEKLRAGFRA